MRIQLNLIGQQLRTGNRDLAEYPLIMNGREVRAVVDGRKTDFIRVVTNATIKKYNKLDPQWQGVEALAEDWENYMVNRDPVDQKMVEKLLALSPYGGDGDRLWIRETHFASRPKNLDPKHHSHPKYDVWIDGEVPARPAPGKPHVMMGPVALVYRATGKNTWHGHDWRRSIKMWRWANRIELINESMRIMRIQDIDIEGAMRQGICWNGNGFVSDEQGHNFNHGSAKMSLASWWDEMCQNNDNIWYSENPYVWVGSCRVDELRVGVVKAEDLKMKELG